MNKLIKILVASSLFLSSLLFAQVQDEKIINFEKSRFSNNKRIEIKDVTIQTKKKLPVGNWYGYIINVQVLMAGKQVKAKDIIFSDGNVVASELYDINNQKSFHEMILPDLSSKYYDKSKLIVGNTNSKNKIVVFSDPLCPFCKELLPPLIKHVKENSDSIALYYYHFPLLRIHPASSALVRLMSLARKKGIKDVELKVYGISWDKYFTVKETDEKKIIDAFNKEFKTSFIHKNVANEKLKDEIFKDLSKGEDLMIQGTPAIFINGKRDNTKLKYQMLGN